jgi:hypothetical protein
MFFRHHCKFQSRNIKFQSPVIKLQDGVINTSLHLLVFLQIICLGYSTLRPKARKLKPKFDNFPVFRFCPIFYMLFIDIKSQLFCKNYFCCNFLKLNLYYDWTISFLQYNCTLGQVWTQHFVKIIIILIQMNLWPMWTLP